MKKHLLFQIILSSVIATVLLSLWSLGVKKKFEDFGLGEGTSAFYAKRDNGYPLDVDFLDVTTTDSMLQGWRLAGEKDVIFVLGNSQTRAINQQKPGDANYVQLLNHEYGDGFDVLGHAFPNANLQELFLSFVHWSDHLPIKYLLLPVFMDDLRESGIKETYFSEIPRSLIARFENDSSAIASKIMTIIEERSATDSINSEALALKNTIQEQVEQDLDAYLNSQSRTWASRSQFRGDVLSKLFHLRNTVFQIDAQSKRVIIPRLRDANMQALNRILEICEAKNIETVLYIPPIRNDVELPYIESDYAKFKQDLSDLSKKFSVVSLTNLEGIIPGQYWGYKLAPTVSREPEYDFMHFQYEGHKILFQELSNVLNQKLK